MLIANVLFFGGFILAAIGLINLTAFDGSIKRIIICIILILIGLFVGFEGDYKRNNIKIEYEVIENIPTNNDGTRYRVVLKAGSDSTILYLSKEEAEDFSVGEVVNMSKTQLKEYKK